MIRFSSRRLLSLCTVIVAVFSLALSGPAFLPPADAAEVLRVTAGDGKSFYSYSTRLDLKRAYYLLNIEGGTRPYTFSLTKPFVVVEPSYPGAQVSFKVIPKAVGTTVLTVKDTKGNTMVREIVVYDPGVQPLALGVLPGASNPVAVGQGRGFGVSGGKAPYTVVSANPGIARVEARTNLYMVWGVAAGSTQITVTDAAGAKVQGTVHVGTTKPLSVSADASILAGGKGELVISSGNPPYSVSTSPHLSAALKGNDAHGRTVYTLTAKSTGQGTVTVRDGAGQTTSKTVTIKEWVTLSFPKLTAEPRALDVGQTTPLSVSGGKPPYTVTASNPSAVTIQQQAAGQYAVTGRQAAVVGIVAKDSTGETRELSLIVRNLPTLTLAAPSTLTVGSTGTLTLVGGAGPFSVTVSGSQLTATKVEEKKYTLTAKSAGSAVITVKDAKGTTKQHTVVVNAVPVKIELPAGTMVIGGSGTFDVKGGVGPYTVTLSNTNAKATLSATSSSYTRYAVTAVAVGTVDITARDSKGASATARLTIQAAPLKLFVSSSTLQLGATGTAAIRVLSIQGGVAPYTASVSGNQLTLTQVNATQFQMTPKAKGTATITVRDSKGTTATQAITVQ